MVTKGALQNVLAVCTSAEAGKGTIVDIATVRDKIQGRLTNSAGTASARWGSRTRRWDSVSRISKDHEAGMTFSGFLVSVRPAQPKIVETITSLKKPWRCAQIITATIASSPPASANRWTVRCAIAHRSRTSRTERYGTARPREQCGCLRRDRTQIKRSGIILALKKAGHVVGTWAMASTMPRLFMPPMSVFLSTPLSTFAKEAADIVLLENDLSRLVDGVREGRATFANTLKYVFMATSGISETCSVWPACPSFCHFSRCSPNRCC